MQRLYGDYQIIMLILENYYTIDNQLFMFWLIGPFQGRLFQTRLKDDCKYLNFKKMTKFLQYFFNF